MALPHPCTLGLNRTVLKCLAEKGKRGEEERKKRKKREREEGGRPALARSALSKSVVELAE